MLLTEQHKHFFNTFGFIAFQGLLVDSIGWITEEFESVFRERFEIKPHDGVRRYCIVPFIDQSERLCGLLDDPRILEIAEGLLGENFNYVAGDGNYYVGDTLWHSDGWHEQVKFIKMALYLDPLTKDTGCLRVIPGSHKIHDQFALEAQGVMKSQEQFGIAPDQIPAVPLETNPGDLVIFYHNTKHAAFGGNARRRMFTLNLCEHCRTPEQIGDLRSYINSHDRFWNDTLHSSLMRETASPERMKHLQQVIANEGELAARARIARETMLEPSRG